LGLTLTGSIRRTIKNGKNQLKIGKRLRDTIKSIEKQGVVVSRTRDVYKIKGKNYYIEITINPKKWLGLNFSLLEGSGGKCLDYSIDTDLYDISNSEFYVFVSDIEGEIVDFLSCLFNKHLQIAQQGKKMALLIPKNGRWLLIARGRFFTKSQYYTNPEELEKKWDFKPLEP
jgi:hypothetical protein